MTVDMTRIGDFALDPGDAGRRSRRGFAYQDVAALHACLDMHDGLHVSVSWEGLEDILCTSTSGPLYRQVKTLEGFGDRFSVATICRAKKIGEPATSILGKLFSGKPLPDGTVFSLLLNETPLADLSCFIPGNSVPPGEWERSRDLIVSKLAGLVLINARDLKWCVDRLEVRVESRDIDELEGRAANRILPIAELLIGQAPLAKEVDAVLIELMTQISREAFARELTEVSAEAFKERLEVAVAKVSGRDRYGSSVPLVPLSDKLSPTGMTAEEIVHAVDSMLRFRQLLRSAVGSTAIRYERLTDDIHAVCQKVMMRRRCGRVGAGHDSYLETLEAVSSLPQVENGDVSLGDAYAALSLVTGRCQNRYADAS